MGLMARSVIGFATFMALNIMVASRGPIAFASHEIAKQSWAVTSQAFTVLDVACQALVASHLGGVSSPMVPEGDITGLR